MIETKTSGSPAPFSMREEPEAEIAVHIGHLVHGGGDDHRPGNDQVFRLDLVWIVAATFVPVVLPLSAVADGPVWKQA
jgi:hypothetical protein